MVLSFKGLSEVFTVCFGGDLIHSQKFITFSGFCKESLINEKGMCFKDLCVQQRSVA